jgi:hypothetical protein
MRNIKHTLIAVIAVTALFSVVRSAFAQFDPSITVSDQAIIENAVVVDSVVSNGPGWLVIYAEEGGRPSSILGYSWVADGETQNVGVEIDATGATETLYAKLHVDDDKIGTFQFPEGPDGPMPSENWEVVEGFEVTVGVGVADQPVIDGTVSVAEVFSAGPGWIVIQAQADGRPGPFLGHSPVVDGANSNVVVDIDTAYLAGTLYAVLFSDAGTLGLYEFPGSDVPVEAAGHVIGPAFRVIGAEPSELPEAGRGAAIWPLMLVALGALVLAGGLGIAVFRGSR